VSVIDQQARNHYGYKLAQRRVPNHLRDGLIRYLIDRIPPGGFLQHVIAGDLFAAAAREEPTGAIGPVARFLLLDTPNQSHGSPARLAEWVGPERAARLEVLAARLYVAPEADPSASSCSSCKAKGVPLATWERNDRRYRLCELCFAGPVEFIVDEPKTTDAALFRATNLAANAILASMSETYPRPNEASPTDRSQEGEESK
jgi:hypothetical protein